MINLFTKSKAKFIESIPLILTLFCSLESKPTSASWVTEKEKKKKLKLIKTVHSYLKYKNIHTRLKSQLCCIVNVTI